LIFDDKDSRDIMQPGCKDLHIELRHNSHLVKPPPKTQSSKQHPKEKRQPNGIQFKSERIQQKQNGNKNKKSCHQLHIP